MTTPAVGVTYEDNPELHHLYHSVELEAAFTGAGRVFGAFIHIDGVERLAGVAIWFEPGKQFLDEYILTIHPPPSAADLVLCYSDEQLGYWASFSNKLDSDTRQWWKEVMLPRYNQLTTEGLGEGVKKGLLHLQVLGIHPDFQRRGVGKALVRYMLVRGDSQGVASCVETAKETNVSFYVGLGFEIKSEKEIPSPYGNFTMWCLRREPNAGKELLCS
ncbi:unnamed protein product [Rhizoctonia solani]|uniref:N-acetyltransferase domain-containing protein n=1 Tax=Rhizoctonia solani TaxID=456999 RepID=A0A8H3DDC5_9AGAM|nr:unnamed protein product [Rhizoctonia solani]